MILASLTESAAQVTLTGSTMIFGITNDNTSLLGLLGTGVPTGTLSLDYLVDGTAPSGPIGVRFIGDATISNLNITTAPVPEPGGSVLIASVGLLFLLRRRRLGSV